MSSTSPSGDSPTSDGASQHAQSPYGAAEASQLLAAIVESSEDAIIGEDLDGLITSWNFGAEQMFGYSAAEAVGQSISLLHSRDDANEMQSILAMISRGERATHFETTRRHKDGREIVVSMSISPIRDKQGKIIGASKIVRDITAQKQADLVLRMAEKLAVAGRLAASVAHEINNPLTALTNLHFLLRREQLSEEAKQYLWAAERELARITHITTQALGFYREWRPVDEVIVSSVLDSAVTLHLHRIESKAVTVVRDYRECPPIQCHAGELRQVFVNLISNALDAMSSEGVLSLRIRPAVHRKTNRRGVRVSIADTGTGMPAEIRSRLFEPFFTTRGPMRTGLGLWVCRQIVSRHDGLITARSRSAEQGHGSIVSIFLPEHSNPEPVTHA